MGLTNGVHHEGDSNDAKAPPEDLTTSPYSTRPINIKIGVNGVNYTLFQAMVDRYPGLQARIQQKNPDDIVELPEIDDDIGHTFVHFIFTGEYRTLGLGGISEDVRAIAEFRRSILAYFAARLCAIVALERLTREKMEQYGRQATIFELQEVVSDVVTRLPPNEVWFPERLHTWVKSSLQSDDCLVADEKLLDFIGRTPLFDKAVVRAIAEMYQEKAEAMKLLSQEFSVEHSTTKSLPTVDKAKSYFGACNGNEGSTQPDDEPNTNLAPEAENVTVLSTSPNALSIEPVESNREVDRSLAESEHEFGGVADEGSGKADSVMAPENEEPSTEGENLITEKKVPAGNVGKEALEDSEVEAAMQKAGKKKKKGRRKGGSVLQATADLK